VEGVLATVSHVDQPSKGLQPTKIDRKYSSPVSDTSASKKAFVSSSRDPTPTERHLTSSTSMEKLSYMLDSMAAAWTVDASHGPHVETELIKSIEQTCVDIKRTIEPRLAHNLTASAPGGKQPPLSATSQVTCPPPVCKSAWHIAAPMEHRRSYRTNNNSFEGGSPKSKTRC